jgi:hypothetical protein
MKSLVKLIPMVLALALASWAQTSTQNPPSTSDQQTVTAPQSESKTADCPCCQKMADSKAAMPCCHQAAKGKDAAMACCSGKDGKSCTKGDKSAKAACADGKCCDRKVAKNCCKGMEPDGKMAMACCGSGQCGMGHHDQANMDK